jgi:hypothetical protein
MGDLARTEPVYLSIALIGFKGLALATPNDMWGEAEEHSFDRDVILLPEVQVKNIEEGPPYATTLAPIADLMWQAGGHARSPHRGRGVWNPLRRQ